MADKQNGGVSSPKNSFSRYEQKQAKLEESQQAGKSAYLKGTENVQKKGK